MDDLHVRRRLLAATTAHRTRLVDTLDNARAAQLQADWGVWSHEGQRPPPGNWRTWMIKAGRGFGKTRAGTEWVLSQVRQSKGTGPNAIQIALVGATVDEARRVMVEGPSGILTLAAPDEISEWQPAQRRLIFRNDAALTLFSGASPESLRGPEHDFAWCDELAKWRHAQATWDNLQLGLRRGVHPRAIITTTPRSGPVLAGILAQRDTVVTGGATQANPHLPDSFITAITSSYAGTRLAVQEIEGRLLPDVEGSLWPVELLARARAAVPVEISRVVIGVDPPASANGTCGIIVCVRDAAEKAYVIADASVSGCSPEGWARAVATAAEVHQADRIIVEKNQGGDMVKSVLRAASATLPITAVHASHGKAARAEPVAALFESGAAFFAGSFPLLEAELAGLVPGGAYQGPGPSPDRADAMVWALTALSLNVQNTPRIRMP
jgi:phage terminase large subunit-like protein